MDVRRLFSGINLIAIGLVLLANMTGQLSWSVWWNVVSLWPLLVISVGLDIMASSTKARWPNVVGSLILLAGFGYAVLGMPTGAAAPAWLWSVNGSEGAPFSQTLTPSSPASPTEWWGLEVSDTASSVTIRSSSGELFRMDGRSTPPVPEAGTFMISKYSSPGPQLVPGWLVRVRRGDAQGPRPYGGSEMRLALSREASWTVSLQTGAGSVDADLADLKVNRVSVKTGAGNVALRLPSAPPDTAVTVEAGVGSVQIAVPRTADVTIVDHGALVAHDYQGFVRVGSGTPATMRHAPEADGVQRRNTLPPASSHITITLSVAVGAVSVTTY